ncbi:hypothetical protein D3C87_1680800 [compost metagenome]
MHAPGCIARVQAAHIHRAFQHRHPHTRSYRAAVVQIAHQKPRAHRRQDAAARADGERSTLRVLRGRHQDFSFQQHHFALAGGVAQVHGAGGVQFQPRAVRQGQRAPFTGAGTQVGGQANNGAAFTHHPRAQA